MSSANTVAAVKNATSIEEQITRLRQLKNEIIGHEQRKETVIKEGLVQPLLDTIANAAKGRERQDGGVPLSETPSWSWTPEDEARLQATLVLGVIANSGPAFVAPLLAGNAQRILISGLTGKTQPRLVLATLQALQNILASTSDAREMSSIDSRATPDFFDDSVIAIIYELLPEDPTKSASKQIALVASIISYATKDNGTRTLLAKSRVLDRFAQYLADYAISQEHVPRQMHLQVPARTPAEAILPSILDAVSTIVGTSSFRVHRFMQAMAQNHVFVSSLSSPSTRLVPVPPTPSYKSVSFQGGPQALPTAAASGALGESGPYDAYHGGCGSVANSLCAWLIHLARSQVGAGRLAALDLLAKVNNVTDGQSLSPSTHHEYMQKLRERARKLSLYAVPLAVKLVQQAADKGSKALDSRLAKEAYMEKPNSCDVLAQLVVGSRELQTAAVEAGAIKHLCAILKKSFDNVTLHKPMWNPKATANGSANAIATCQIGGRGLPSEIMQVMRSRKGALAAIAAITSAEDLHRKAVKDAGVVPCIIDSLKPFPDNIEQKMRAKGGRVSPKDGNTVETIIAACGAAQAMSRSVSLLRTSLIDAGICKPLFLLITHPDDDIKTVATNVCCNLLLDFSPMREDIIAAGAVKVLTEHARTGHPLLRLGSLWSLKHLVLTAPKEVKISTLEELGLEWLMSVISGDRATEVPTTHSNSGGVSVADLLNPTSMDVDSDPSTKPNNDAMDDSDGEVMYDDATSLPYQSSGLRSTLKSHPAPTFSLPNFQTAVRSLETHEAATASRHATAIREQSLDFLRNLINGDSSAFMTDHLLSQVGTPRLLNVLTTLLTPVPQGSNLQNPPSILLSALHLLNHIAAASPRHRALITSTPPLLQAWLPLFTHPSRDLRVMSVWAIINLTWVEDESDRRPTRHRTQILRDMGFVDAVGRLQADPDLDVRERVRTVERQIQAL